MKVLPNTFHLNGHAIWFHPQTLKVKTTSYSVINSTTLKSFEEVPYLAYHVRSDVKRQARNTVDQQEYEPASDAAPYGHMTQLQGK